MLDSCGEGQAQHHILRDALRFTGEVHCVVGDVDPRKFGYGSLHVIIKLAESLRIGLEFFRDSLVLPKGLKVLAEIQEVAGNEFHVVYHAI